MPLLISIVVLLLMAIFSDLGYSEARRRVMSGKLSPPDSFNKLSAEYDDISIFKFGFSGAWSVTLERKGCKHEGRAFSLSDAIEKAKSSKGVKTIKVSCDEKP